MINVIVFVICFIGLVIGSIIDLKTREVPDYLTFALIAIGFAVALLASVVFWNISYVVASLFGFTLCLVFACTLFYTGQWGGGDAKMLMAMGALLGVSYKELESFFFIYFFESLPFLFLFLMLIFLFGGIYGFFWIGFLIIKHWKHVKKNYARILRQHRRERNVLFIVVGILLIQLLFLDDIVLRVVIIGVVVLAFVLYYSFFLTRVVENIGFVKRLPLHHVTEGDWIARDVVVNGKVILSKKNPGLTREQLALLKRKNIKFIMVKYGIPFVPSFLIAFVVTIIIFYLL